VPPLSLRTAASPHLQIRSGATVDSVYVVVFLCFLRFLLVFLLFTNYYR